ncbi:MAG: hypothetical protein WDM86_18850 [Rhizomicrobium sp.]
MRSITKLEVVGYAVFAGLFAAVLALRPAHGAEAPLQRAPAADVNRMLRAKFDPTNPLAVMPAPAGIQRAAG